MLHSEESEPWVYFHFRFLSFQVFVWVFLSFVSYKTKLFGKYFTDDVSKVNLSTMQLQYKSTTEAAIAWAKSIAESSLKSGTYSVEADLHRFCAWSVPSPLKDDGSGFKDSMDA